MQTLFDGSTHSHIELPRGQNLLCSHSNRQKLSSTKKPDLQNKQKSRNATERSRSGKAICQKDEPEVRVYSQGSIVLN